MKVNVHQSQGSGTRDNNPNHEAQGREQLVIGNRVNKLYMSETVHKTAANGEREQHIEETGRNYIVGEHDL